MRIAVFPGSFDPYTIGHQDIVKRATRIFDKVIIAVGINMEKIASCVEERVQKIRACHKDDEKVEVLPYKGLTAQFAKQHDATSIVRGIRDARDLEYERNLAIINKQVFGIETVFLLADPTLMHISSSAVRELRKYGCDVSAFLPHSDTSNLSELP